MQEVKWGIIGTGNVVEKKSGPILNSFENSSIVAIMGRDINKTKQIAKKINSPKYFDNIDNLLDNKDINAIYIATPPGLHLEQAKKCCEAKISTYIEKPIARNYQEALQIVDMYEKAKVPLYVAHFYRALPKFIKIKELLESNVIGKVCEVDFKLNRKYSSSTLDTWLYNTELSGGGKFYDIAPHSIDLMVYLFGKFTEVYGIATNNIDEYKVEDVVTMTFKTEKGILGTANFNSITLEKSDVMIVNGTKGKMEFSVHDNSLITIIKDGEIQNVEIDSPEIAQENMIKNVVNSLIKKEQLNVCTAQDAIETYRIMDKVLENYYNGRNDDFWNRIDTWNVNN